MNVYIVQNMYLSNKTSIPVFYHGHKIWVLVLVRVIKSIVCYISYTAFCNVDNCDSATILLCE